MNRLSVSLLLALAAAPLSAAESSAGDQNARSDCLAEGEAGGLSGKDLDDFVAQCLKDLQALQLVNPAD